MKVLLLAQFYPPVIGGEERHVRNLAVALARLGHDVHVATLRVDGFEPTTDPGVTVHVLDSIGTRIPGIYAASERPLSLPTPDPMTSRDLARVAKQLQPDVVHAHNWIVNSWLPVPAARRAPLVLSLHDYSHVCATKRLVFEDQVCPGPDVRRCVSCVGDHFGTLRGLPIYAAVQAGRPFRNRQIDAFTPVSQYVATANRLDDRVKWQVVPNFIPDEFTDVPLAPRGVTGLDEGDYFFFAGDLSRQKGLHTILAAYQQLPEATRPGLVMVGTPIDPLPDRLPSGVVIEHRWPHERVVAGFQHALAAVLPSEWPDPCPTTVLEAMALGAPVITTDRGGIADMVTHLESALVVRAGDADDLAVAMTRMGEDPALRSQLAAGARVQVRGFLQSAVAQTVSDLYEDLVSAPA